MDRRINQSIPIQWLLAKIMSLSDGLHDDDLTISIQQGGPRTVAESPWSVARSVVWQLKKGNEEEEEEGGESGEQFVKSEVCKSFPYRK